MFRYVAWVWNTADPAQSSLVKEFSARMERKDKPWQLAFHMEGLKVYCEGARAGHCEPHVLQEGQGILLGKVFYSKPGFPHFKLNGMETAAIVKSCGRYLVDQCWGRYVCFLYDPMSKIIRVLRDPSGVMRCFMTGHKGVRLFCSNTEDFVSLGLSFSINWSYVVSELVLRSAMRWDQTGLSEISALVPGECLEIRDNEVKNICYWHPLRLATNPIENSNEAAALLRIAVRGSVQAWASCHSKLVMMISGGIDSSIMLSCLQNSPHIEKTVCYTYHYPSLLNDERMYARISAERAGCELIERPRSTDVRIDSLLKLPKSARPASNNYDNIVYGPFVQAAAREQHASAMFIGLMGDQLFGKLTAHFAVMDCMQMKCLSASLLGVALDAARVDTNRSILSALSHGILNGLLCKGRMGRVGRGRLVGKEPPESLVDYGRIRRLNGPIGDEWFKSTCAVPIGKLFHISLVWAGQAFHDFTGGAEDPDWVFPLYSQPVIEVCLRLPNYLMIQGGWDRSIARQAFAADVPREIIARRPKGTAVGQRKKIFADNIEFVRELLLNGILVREGLLKKRMLEEHLSGDPTAARNHHMEQYLWTEAWLRVWSR